ncbi:hypothetical protein BpHYR1_015451 [Brachionus plicatilis]|uniref:Uncharacterized protein n=1 Tax=Brachionus plicatilis TaxID=10195 RepID=A0A3M7S9T4_BRAPC|nr:hypothetical protein BpHYR1_015451 [Brachionus plicatilis]
MDPIEKSLRSRQLHAFFFEYECECDSNYYLNRQKLAQTIKKLGGLKLVSICSLQLAYISLIFEKIFRKKLD